MSFVPWEILFVYQKIVVCVQLPEAAVQDVEMLVREVLPNDIYIIFIWNLHEYIK